MAIPEEFLGHQLDTIPPPAAPAELETDRPRRPKRKSAHPTITYDTVALTAAEWSEVAFWSSIWILDAWFTATFLQLVVGLSLPFGFAVHVVVSFIQQHLWRLGWREHFLPVAIVASGNIGTSIIGLWALLGRWFPERAFDVFGRTTSAPAAPALFYGAMVIALLIAVMPERHLSKYLRNLLVR